MDMLGPAQITSADFDRYQDCSVMAPTGRKPGENEDMMEITFDEVDDQPVVIQPKATQQEAKYRSKPRKILPYVPLPSATPAPAAQAIPTISPQIPTLSPKEPPPFSFTVPFASPQPNRKRQATSPIAEDAQGAARPLPDVFRYIEPSPSVHQLQIQLEAKIKAFNQSRDEIMIMSYKMQGLERTMHALQETQKLKQQEAEESQSNVQALEAKVNDVTAALEAAKQDVLQVKKEAERSLDKEKRRTAAVELDAHATVNKAEDEAAKEKRTLEDELLKSKRGLKEERANALHANAMAEKLKLDIADARKAAARAERALADAQKAERRGKQHAGTSNTKELRDKLEESRSKLGEAREKLRLENARTKAAEDRAADAEKLAAQRQIEMVQQCEKYNQMIEEKIKQLEKANGACKVAEAAAEEARNAEAKRRVRIDHMTTEMNALKELLNHANGRAMEKEQHANSVIKNCAEMVKDEVQQRMASEEHLQREIVQREAAEAELTKLAAELNSYEQEMRKAMEIVQHYEMEMQRGNAEEWSRQQGHNFGGHMMGGGHMGWGWGGTMVAVPQGGHGMGGYPMAGSYGATGMPQQPQPPPPQYRWGAGPAGTVPRSEGPRDVENINGGKNGDGVKMEAQVIEICTAPDGMN